MKRPRPRPEDFTVGWIAALPVELAAARHILDEEYESGQGGYEACYILGRIGKHQVVIGCLPGGWTGTTSAAVFATQMNAHFPCFQARLMVGIGGGVPSTETDVRLGDVVVSQPHKGRGGVVQYDFGKAGVDGQFEPTGFLNKPPDALLTLLPGLQAQTLRLKSNVWEGLAAFDDLPEFTLGNAGPDILFRADSNHVPGATCERCDRTATIARSIRQDDAPVVHYGTIASGNQVIKDAATRDKRSSDLGGVLCFEMEAAGLMNSFPCLVIRGICDYADSHKNKTWQSYAAATAAVYAKELLLLLPLVSGLDNYTLVTKSFSRQDTLESLKFDRMDDRLRTINSTHAKTCEWLLAQHEYKTWLDASKMSDHHGFLWIKGKPAAGKSTIMKFLYGRTKSTLKKATIISFFFNARGELLERTVPGMYRSLLYQLLTQLPDLQSLIDPIAPTTTDVPDMWDIDTVKDIFKRAVERLKGRELICFIDALDECPEDDIRDMVAAFEELGEATASSQLRFLVCFSSRHYPHITIQKHVGLVLEDQEGHQLDIESYIRNKLKGGRSKRVEQIRERVLEKASGIFLWVVLVIPMLNKAIDHGRVHDLPKLLEAIPADLEDLFLNIFHRDNEDINGLVLCLQWILFARWPLSPEELYFAVQSEDEDSEILEWDPEYITQEDIKNFINSVSKGLAELTRSKDPRVQLIHESVRDFLLKKDGFGKLQSHLHQNSYGLGHERLKNGCCSYMRMKTSDHLSKYFSGTALPAASSKEGAGLRKLAASKYPFLAYAVQNILYHADEAERYRIAQDIFVQDFALGDWIVLENLFQKFEVRRHSSGASLLYILAEQNLPNLTHIRLRQVRHMNIPGERYGFPSHVALQYGNKAALEALLAPGTDTWFTSNTNPRTTQHSTVKECEEVITLLLQKGQSIASSKKKTLLSWATENGHEAVVKLLLKTGAVDVDSRDSHGQTPLSWAVKNRHEAVVKLLLETGAVDVDSKDSLGQTPLSWAAENGHEAVVKLLLDTGAVDVDSRDSLGQTPLSWAARNGDEAVVKLLLDTGAVDVDSKDFFGLAPLHWAAENGHGAVVNLFKFNNG